MNTQPLLSIITINFNNKMGLQRTFNSVFTQSFNNYEYIVIDGASNDGSKDFINQEKKQINYFVSEPDSGVYNAMNKGIKNSNGKYLLFLNSGDELYNEKILEKYSKEIHTEDLIYFDLLQIYNNRETRFNFPVSLTPFTFIKGTIGHPSTFIKRNLFDKIGYYDESLKIVSDWKFFIFAVVKYNCSYRKINGILSKFYMDGISSRNKYLGRDERKTVLDKHFSEYLKLYKKEKRKKKILGYLNITNHLNNFFEKINLTYLKIKYWLLISLNQLTYLKKLINFLIERKFSNIVIIDNNSSYSPLLEYFNSLSDNKSITIHRLQYNIGHLVFWKKYKIFKKYSKGYYVITDADIVPEESTPNDFMNKFMNLLNSNYTITKVGFSLSIDDIPDRNPNKKYIVFWEKQYWEDKKDDYFISYIDTTFALYRPRFKRKKVRKFLKAFRVNKPYTAKHGGWYLDAKNLTDEQKYYNKTSNKSSTSKIDEDGILINNILKNHYEINQSNSQ